MTPAFPRVPGFRFSGVACGIKASGRDLALFVSDAPAAAAGVLTRSTVVGAPVVLCRERLRAGRARAIVVNSGCSNVAMGARGERDAREMARLAARAVGADERQVLVASTGVIGEPLPMARIRAGVRAAAERLAEDGLGDAARAILTTDTREKIASRRLRIGRRDVVVAGVAKGAGMIEPNMATMLAFLFTDAAVAPPFLRAVLRRAADASFNRLSVDGESSTSDTALLLASGVAGHPVLRGPRSPGARRFEAAVRDVACELARELARDGEGATRLVTVRVEGARSNAEAERGARRIANSLLVKTAIHGGDPNWGRILQTLGAARIRLNLARTEVRLGGVVVFRRGASTGPAARRRAAARHREPEIEIAVHLGSGRGSCRLWTCDLSKEYVAINAEYTT